MLDPVYSVWRDLFGINWAEYAYLIYSIFYKMISSNFTTQKPNPFWESQLDNFSLLS